MEDMLEPRSYISTERHASITAEQLSDHFCIGLEQAKRTLRVTHQRGTHSAILLLSRRYRADRRFDIRRLKDSFATDTLFSKVKSLHSNIASQMYSHKCRFKKVYHLRRIDGENVGHTLTEFVHDFGAPDCMVFDGAAVQTGPNTLFNKNLRRSNIHSHLSSPGTPKEDSAEPAIG